MKTELVFIPLPATGHLVPAVQLAKLLVGRDDELSIRILLFKIPLDANASSYVQSLLTETTSAVQYIQLPDPQPIIISSEAKPQNPFALLSRQIESQKPQVRNVISQLKDSGESSRLAGIIIDMFCTAMIDVANEFEMPTYVFYSSGAAILGLRHHVQCLIDDKRDNDIKQYKEFSVSTSINPVPAKLCPPAMLDENGSLNHTRRLIGETKAIMVNSFLELEPYAIQALNRNPKMPTIYPVAPLINLEGFGNKQENDSGTTIFRWLDDQPNSSVIFLCFGSFGSFQEDQVKEIAYGLEQSGCKFLWSLRRPPPKERLEYPGEYENHQEVLPEGFLERNSRVGKVIGWAPQARVLAHPAVGGFVTHCGWNSVLESIWFGVPMATWPMYAEQHMNASLLVQDFGIAVEIKTDDSSMSSRSTKAKVVGADEIEDVIRKLMQPESEVRKKVKELMEKARTASVDGGSSYISLGSLIEDFHGSLKLKEAIDQK